jgi:hypothetical protein
MSAFRGVFCTVAIPICKGHFRSTARPLQLIAKAKFGTECVCESRFFDDLGQAFRQPSRHEHAMLLASAPALCLRHFSY